jgi:hypothetical protein
MAFDYTLFSFVNTDDRLKYSSNAAIHLSDGTLAMLAWDTGAVQLLVSDAGHTIATELGFVPADFTLAGPLSVTLCRDPSDNIYVVGFAGSSLIVQCWARQPGTPAAWNPSSVSRYDPGGTAPPTLTGVAALWCDTGLQYIPPGGVTNPNQPTGTLLVLYDTSTGPHGVLTLYAAQAYLGLPLGATNGTFFWNPTGSAALAGTNLDLEASSFGATNGLLAVQISASTLAVAAWSVFVDTSGAAFSSATALSTTLPVALTVSKKVRVVRYGSGRFAVISPKSGGNDLEVRGLTSTAGPLSAPATISGDANFPSNPANDDGWDVSGDPSGNTCWVYGTGDLHLFRKRIDFSGNGTPTVNAGVTDRDYPAGASGISDLRVVKQPIDFLNVDWQVDFAATTRYLGCGSSLAPAVPDQATLLTPAAGAVADFASGGTLTWQYNSSTGEQPTAFYIRRRIFGGNNPFEYWNGSTHAWQSAEYRNPGSAQSYTFGAGKWTQGVVYAWTVKTEGPGGTSTYPIGFKLGVQFQPAPGPPTFMASYDATNNRVHLTLQAAPPPIGTQPVAHGSIEYSDDGGATWNFVRGATNLTVGSSSATSLYDYEAPPQPFTRQYRARGWTAYPWTYTVYVTASVSPQLSTYWLRDPVDGFGAPIYIRAGSVQTAPRRAATVHQPPGRPNPIVVADSSGGKQTNLIILTENEDDEAQLEELLGRISTLVFMQPNVGNEYVFVLGNGGTDTTYEVTDNASFREHAVTLVRVDRP